MKFPSKRHIEEHAPWYFIGAFLSIIALIWLYCAISSAWAEGKERKWLHNNGCTMIEATIYGYYEYSCNNGETRVRSEIPPW